MTRDRTDGALDGRRPDSGIVRGPTRPARRRERSPATMETVSEARCAGGVQKTIRHQSEATGTPMQVSIFLPPAPGG